MTSITQHLRRHTLRWTSVAAFVLLSGCAAQQHYAEGLAALDGGRPEEGISSLRLASELEPSNAQYRLRYLTSRTSYTGQRIDLADAAMKEGNFDEARNLLREAAQVDPSNERVTVATRRLYLLERTAAGMKEVEQRLEKGNTAGARERVSELLRDTPDHKPLQAMARDVEERFTREKKERAEASRAVGNLRKPVTLQFRDANLKQVFEAVSRSTGMNIVVDRDVRNDLKTTIFVRDTSVMDTIDLILLQSQLEKRILNGNTIFVYPATAAKKREYEELHVRTFQLSNVDVRYMQNALKTLLKSPSIVIDERTNTLVLRDTSDAIQVAERIIAAHEVAEPEVELEVAVLEVTRERLTNLGVQFPHSFGIAHPSSGTSGSSFTWGDMKAVTRDQLVVTPISGALNFKLQDTDASLLASPRIRARNREKARVLIGDRVPVITNTVTPVQTGTSVVTGSVQYLDVGIKLEVEPQVYMDSEVGIRINLEVSSLVREIPGPNGSLAYQIGTRNAQTSLRLRNGETQVLAGLISDNDRTTAAKLPGLGQLPLLGRLFSNNSGTATKSEIILSITPRVVRGQSLADARVRDVSTGTETSVKSRTLDLDPIGSVRAISTGGPSNPNSAPPQTTPRNQPAATSSTRPAATTAARPAGRPANASEDADAGTPAEGSGDAAAAGTANAPAEGENAPAQTSPPTPAPAAPAPRSTGLPANDPSLSSSQPAPLGESAAAPTPAPAPVVPSLITPRALPRANP